MKTKMYKKCKKKEANHDNMHKVCIFKKKDLGQLSKAFRKMCILSEIK